MSWKKLLCCVMIVVLCSGCQSRSSPTQEALDFRTALLEAGGCSFTAAIQADLGDKVYSFTVSCLYSTDGLAQITVLQPEEIAGIAAIVSDGGASIEFQDIELDLGVMADGRVSPMEACHVLGRSWAGAYIASAGADGDLQRITWLDGYEEEELTVDTWLNESCVPVYAEISCEGTRWLTLQLNDFQFEDEL